MGLENGARKVVEKMRRTADAFGSRFCGYDGAAFGGKPAARHTAVFAGALFLPMVTVWYLLAEIGSIMENAAAMGAPMPRFFKKSIETMQNSISTGKKETGKRRK